MNDKLEELDEVQPNVKYDNDYDSVSCITYISETTSVGQPSTIASSTCSAGEMGKRIGHLARQIEIEKE